MDRSEGSSEGVDVTLLSGTLKLFNLVNRFKVSQTPKDRDEVKRREV